MYHIPHTENAHYRPPQPPMQTISITYHFKFPDRTFLIHAIELEEPTLTFIAPLNDDTLPEWTRLTYHQCPNCPLDGSRFRSCPLAARLAPVVRLFQNIISYQTISLEVITDERVVTQETTAQRAVSSLMGVIIACCGCPLTGYFKPMARFHLPLAGKQETIYRSVSMYLLAQYFRQQQFSDGTFSLAGLEAIYLDMQTINNQLVKRLKQASSADSNINAVILLDTIAMAIPFVLNGSLDEIKNLFGAYLAPLPRP